MSQIDLMLDEENELTFQLNIEGTRPAEASCRLLIEAADMSMVFEAAREPDGEISVIIPPLKNVLKEGVYNMNLEVIVDDKYFRPLSLKGNFEKMVKVTAEAVVKKRKKVAKPTASLVEVTRQPTKVTGTRPKKMTGVRPERRKRKAPVVTENKNITDQDILNIIKQLAR